MLEGTQIHVVMYSEEVALVYNLHPSEQLGAFKKNEYNLESIPPSIGVEIENAKQTSTNARTYFQADKSAYPNF